MKSLIFWQLIVKTLSAYLILSAYRISVDGVPITKKPQPRRVNTTSPVAIVAVSSLPTIGPKLQEFPGHEIKSAKLYSNNTKTRFPNCPNVYLNNRQFPFCLHHSVVNDTDISTDASDLIRLLRLLKSFSGSVQFVDIGAGVGTYALPAAQMSNVVAVEPDDEKLKVLAKSMFMSGLEGKCRLVLNSINGTRQLIWPSPANVTFAECRHLANQAPCPNGTTYSIVLNDLTPLLQQMPTILRVDAGQNTIGIFHSEVASEFFQKFSVVLLLVKWRNIKTQCSPTDVAGLLKFFSKKGFVSLNSADDILRHKHSSTLYMEWPDNVVFLRKSFGWSDDIIFQILGHTYDKLRGLL